MRCSWKFPRWVNSGASLVKYSMVTGQLVPRLSDSTKTLACFSHVRRCLSGLLNLMLLRLWLLSTWQPMHTCIWLCFLAWGIKTLKNCLKAFLLIRSNSDAITICLSLFGVLSTNDSSSLSIVFRSCCITWMGLNFIGAGRGGKKAHIVRSKSCITKLFVTWCTWVSEGVVWSARLLVDMGGIGGHGGAMVERGIGHWST